MNRKLRVIILTMVLTVLMFGGTRLMAEDNLDVDTTEASQTETPKDEGNLEPKAKEGEEGESSVEEVNKTDIDGNEADGKDVTAKTVTETPEASENGKTEVNKTETTEGKPEAKQEEKTEAKEADKLADKPAEKAAGTPDVKPADKTAEGNGPEDGAIQAAPAKVPEAQGAPAGAPGEPAPAEQGAPAKGDKKQVDPSKDDELKALQDQIKAANEAKDSKKAAELQKEYNEKYLDKLEKAGADKYADDTAKRLKDKDQIALYNEIKEKKKELDAKLEAGTLTTKDVDDFNNLLGGFTPPRALTEKESEAAKAIGQEPYYPGLDGTSKTNYEAYLQAKKASEADPENQGLKDALKAAENNLSEGEKAWRDYQ